MIFNNYSYFKFRNLSKKPANSTLYKLSENLSMQFWLVKKNLDCVSSHKCASLCFVDNSRSNILYSEYKDSYIFEIRHNFKNSKSLIF